MSASVDIFYAYNRHEKKVAIVQASCWEHLQGMFRCGIVVGGVSANCIGHARCSFEKLKADFIACGYTFV